MAVRMPVRVAVSGVTGMRGKLSSAARMSHWLPAIAVMTNLDREHMETYGNLDSLRDAFVEFANKVPFYGAIVSCADDPELTALRPRLTRRLVTYGVNTQDADITATSVKLEGYGSECTVTRRRVADGKAEALGRLTLQVPGYHSVQNALAAVAAGLELEVPFGRITSALAGFQGVERRFGRRGVVGGITVIDDYGHHPTEITAVLAAVRAAKPARIIVAFQPHRYSRTRDLMEEFGVALAAADEVILTDIYAASEDPIPGVTIDALAAAVNAKRTRPVHLVRALDEVANTLAGMATRGDVVMTFGAGSIGSVASRVVHELERRHRRERLH